MDLRDRVYVMGKVLTEVFQSESRFSLGMAVFFSCLGWLMLTLGAMKSVTAYSLGYGLFFCIVFQATAAIYFVLQHCCRQRVRQIEAYQPLLCCDGEDRQTLH